MVGSPTGKIGGAYFTPYWTEQARRPDDMFLEPVVHTLTGTEDTLTLLTDNTYIDYPSFVFPIIWSATPKPSSISAKTATTFALNGTTGSKQMLYVFGSIGRQAGRIMHFPQLSGYGNKTKGVVWEILYATMDSAAGTYKCTAATVLDHIDRPLYVLPVQVLAAAPDTNGYSVNEMSTIDFTVECGNSTVLAMLVGGLSEATTPTDNATDIDQDLLEYMPLWLGGRHSIHPGDLIGEVVSKTLDGASPATVTVTAATDCEIIRHIELILPVCTHATEYTIGWSGTQGATSAIYAANATADVVNCLVLGY